MSGGVYGFSEGLGKTGVPDNWAGHDPMPSHFRVGTDAAGSYQLDQRPRDMRGGFYPSWMNMDNALGDLNRPVMVLDRSLGEIKEKFLGNPYLVMGAGVLTGAIFLRWFLGGR